jgi:tRNA dimethylallyltransferase
MNFNLITILGPTAVGKTKLAAQLAAFFYGEIISADSRQVYRKMDIGTGKDYSDYTVENKKIPYHLIDIIDPREEYNLFRFVEDFNKSFIEISNKKKIPFLVGGTGMYLDSVLRKYELAKSDFNSEYKVALEKKTLEELREILLSYKPILHNTTDTLHRNRIIKAIMIAKSELNESIKPVEPLNSLTIGVTAELSEIRTKISKRLKLRLKEGMIEEVQNLLNEGIQSTRLKLFGLEYKFITQYLLGELNYNDMYQKLNSAIHKFAKRQLTWFRKMEREGIFIHWIKSGDLSTAKSVINQHTYTFHV